MSSLTHFDPFVWKGQPSTATNDTADGLNRVSRFTTLAGGYDSNGNLTKDGVRTYTYDDENRLTGIPTGPVTTIEAYDPLGRIRARNTSVVGQVYMLEEGDHLIAEYNANGLISSGGNPANPPLRRYVYVPGQNEPIVWYEGTTPYWLHADREGSIIAWSDASGVVTGTGINRTANYGPYGESSTANMPRFGYTGQAFWSESNLYYYKARLYSPALGRFLQTDPIGYEAGDTNLYAYVGEDPESKTDPNGLSGLTLSQDFWLALSGGREDNGQDYVRGVAGELWDGIQGGAFAELPGAAVVSGGRAATMTAEQAAARAGEIQGALDDIAQSKRTTAVLVTSGGQRVVAAGGHDLAPAQRAMLKSGETAAKLKEQHAEVTALEHAAAIGAKPQALGTSRAICPACAQAIEKCLGDA